MAALHRTSAPTYRVVLLGDKGVGIRSLFRRLKDNRFDEYDEYDECQQGIDSCIKVVEVDGETVALSIWKLPNGSKILDDWKDYINPCYFNAHAAVFVYDVSEVESLHSLFAWREVAHNYSPNAVWMLIGNKVDLEPEIDPKKVIFFAETLEIELQFEISCKTNFGIEKAFEQLSRVLHKKSRETDGEFRQVDAQSHKPDYSFV